MDELQSEDDFDFDELESESQFIRFEAMIAHFGKEGRIENLWKASDREYVLAVQSILDALLGEILLAHFKNSSQMDNSRILDLLKGPLQHFAVKHELCGALSLIGEETRKALSALRQLRIRAAHAEVFPQIMKDDLNALRGVCPTLVDQVKKLGVSMASLPKSEETKHLSGERLEFMAIVNQIHALLFYTKLMVEADDDHLAI